MYFRKLKIKVALDVYYHCISHYTSHYVQWYREDKYMVMIKLHTFYYFLPFCTNDLYFKMLALENAEVRLFILNKGI